MGSRYDRSSNYVFRFLKVSKRVERFLFRLGLLGLAGIVVSQCILAIPDLRSMFSSTDQLEGTKASQETTATSSAAEVNAQLTIRPINQGPLPDAWVTLNRVPIGNFSTGEITVTVKSGDVLQIDTSRLDGLYRFVVDHNDPDITSPTPGTEVDTSPEHVGELDTVLIHSTSQVAP